MLCMPGLAGQPLALALRRLPTVATVGPMVLLLTYVTEAREEEMITDLWQSQTVIMMFWPSVKPRCGRRSPSCIGS